MNNSCEYDDDDDDDDDNDGENEDYERPGHWPTIL